MSIDPKRILFRDDSFLAVLKLSGELVVKGKGRVDRLPLLDFLRKEFPGLHPISRLDFETSGVVLFARNRSVLKIFLDTKFAQWSKTYQAIVAHRIDRDQGLISFPLPARTAKVTVEAKTMYRVLERFADASLVEAETSTGRHHQIRRHLRMIGHPLALDAVYGQEKFNTLFTRAFHCRRFFLHASAVSFQHPVTKEMLRIEAPRPKVFEEMLGKLRIEN
ncbi:RluA family pseudouridine synthase [Candidatus Peregrinibacteria bacterium]|nr:RluA family pseudouridine synthase [Candidatus Peregrinibacteria bacterium]MBI3816860.1 RluA family pseudouridine synthase [Candidatus Peregrinibacteria bacterium]